LIRGLFYVKVNSFPDYMFLGNLNKNSSVESVLLQFIVFVIIGILLHFLNLTIIEKKDIMWRE
jgi:phosphotransferase system  glucose/maltose/N-acetylglucosamine-specific IIC component